MRGIAAVIAFGLAITIGSAFAAGPTGEPVGKDPYWCIHEKDPKSIQCGGIDDRPNLKVITFGGTREEKLSNFSFRVCSESPAGNENCIPRRTHHPLNDPPNRNNIVADRFRFASAFPHREPGVYKLRWYRHGEKFGKTFELRLDP